MAQQPGDRTGPRCAVVNSELLSRLKTWSPRNILGSPAEDQEAVDKARKRLARAQAALSKAETAKAAREARFASLVASGQVVLISEPEGPA